VVADLDFSLINTRKILMDVAGHYSRPELLSLVVDRTRRPHVHEHIEQAVGLELEERDYVRI
jgi:aliphatic nitrilase